MSVLPVAASPSDHMDLIDRLPGQSAEFVECPAVFKSQTLQDAARGRGRGPGRFLSRAQAKTTDGLNHAWRVHEIRAVRVNKGPERRGFSDPPGQLLIAPSPARSPFLPAPLHNTETR